jgi:F0F1-type ATP synthase assembly protein I
MKNYYTFDKNFNLKLQKRLISSKKVSKKIPLVNYQEIGYYILTPLLVGVFLGLTIDKIFKTKNLFFFIFLFLGLVADFYNLYKIYKNGK